MQVRIIALTSKGEDALRHYIKVSEDKDREMKSLSRFNPRRVRFEFEQAQAKRFVTEESFVDPLMIVATISPKYSNQVSIFVEQISVEFHRIMLNSGCGRNDYVLEVF
jgi:hypothetical protein